MPTHPNADAARRAFDAFWIHGDVQPMLDAAIDDIVWTNDIGAGPWREVRGKDAVRVDYAYVADPAFATADAAPIVARGSDILLRNGDNLTIVRMLAASDVFDDLGLTWDRILGSLELK